MRACGRRSRGQMRRRSPLPRSPRCIGAMAGRSISTASPLPLRRQGAALVVDATHGAGIMPLDVRTLDPDFLVFPTYKWVLGPYGRAFLYVAKRYQDGVPLEQTGFGRRGIAAERLPGMRPPEPLP